LFSATALWGAMRCGEHIQLLFLKILDTVVTEAAGNNNYVRESTNLHY